MAIILEIDTTDKSGASVRITGSSNLLSDKIHEHRSARTTSSQTLLPLINKVMREAGLQWEQLEEIKVNPGPGSFTGIRVGMAVANMLGWLLGIPVNGQESARPEYSSSRFD